MGDVKSETQDALLLTIRNQSGQSVDFKVKPTTLLGKMFSAYCQKNSVNRGELRFLYDGTILQDAQTVAEAGLEDKDAIDCVVPQIGGCEMSFLDDAPVN